MEERLNKSVNQTLQPILDNICSSKKPKETLQKGNDDGNDGSQGRLANGELLTVLRTLNDQISRIRSLVDLPGLKNNIASSPTNSPKPTPSPMQKQAPLELISTTKTHIRNSISYVIQTLEKIW